MKDINVKFYKFNELPAYIQKRLLNEYVNRYFYDDYHGDVYADFYRGDYQLPTEDARIQKMYEGFIQLPREKFFPRFDVDSFISKLLHTVIENIDLDNDIQNSLSAYSARVFTCINGRTFTDFRYENIKQQDEYNFEKYFNQYDNAELRLCAHIIQENINEFLHQINNALKEIEENERDYETQKAYFDLAYEDELFTETGIKYSDIFGE